PLRPRSDGNQRARLHRQEDLERLRSYLAADELRPALPIGIPVRTLVVDLRDVAGGTVEEDDDRVLPIVALNRLFEVVNVVSGDPAGAGRRVTGEVDHTAEELLFLIPGADNADFRIGRSGRLDDVGISLPGVRDTAAVAHL